MSYTGGAGGGRVRSSRGLETDVRKTGRIQGRGRQDLFS